MTGRPPAPVECLRCSRLRSDDARDALLDGADLSPPPPKWKKREKNGFLLVLDGGGDGIGDWVALVAVYSVRSGASICTFWFGFGMW